MKSEIRFFVESIVIFFIVIIIYVELANKFCPISAPIVFKKNETVLRPDTSVQVSQSEILSHNAITRDFLMQLMVIENAHQVAHQSAKTQMRGFYLAIAAGLLAFLFKSSDFPKRNVLYIILPSLIVVFYMLEIHEDDLYLRYLASYHIYSISAIKLSDSVNVSKTWQSFDNRIVSEKMEDASKFFERWSRILLKATRPAADQIALYILPLFALILVKVREKRKTR